jgi:CBS domain-containing protein
VAKLMAEKQIHCVVVSDYPDNGAEVWGVVSDLDLVAAATVRGLEDQTAGGSAATTVMGVRPGDTLLRAGQLMTENAVSHLVVIDPKTGAPRGVVSTLDVAAALADYLSVESDACSG